MLLVDGEVKNKGEVKNRKDKRFVFKRRVIWFLRLNEMMWKMEGREGF